MEQLFLAVEGIDREEKSPRLVAFETAKREWERFISYGFALHPEDVTYKQLFPYLNNLNSKRLAPDKLEYFADFFDRAREELQFQIKMNYNWHRLDAGDQFCALLHWVEYGDIFPDVDISDEVSAFV